MKPDKDFANGLGESLIHREAGAFPIAGSAEPSELAQDGPAGLFFPGPDPFDELLSSKRFAGKALFRKPPLHHVLRGDPGVIHSWDPKRVAPLHPSPADEDVLQ